MMSNAFEFKVYRSIEDIEYAEAVIKDLVSEMPNHGVEHYFRTKGSMLVKSDTIVVALDEGGHVGIMVLSKEDVTPYKTGLYIRTLLVSERYHRQNLAYLLICYGFNAFYTAYEYFPDFILMTTFNPITYRMMKGFTKGRSSDAYMYPSIASENDYYHKVVATEYASAISPACKFVADTGVIINGGGEIPSTFWRDYPATRDNSVMEYFQSHIGERDRLLCIIFCEALTDKQIIMENLKIKDSSDAIRKHTAVY